VATRTPGAEQGRRINGRRSFFGAARKGGKQADENERNYGPTVPQPGTI